ncbi:hypothetical protein VNO80_18146 [Phaseolus coccineus]|uniref:Uncharacterized protein n=1 Tax=Phaseolus coccineus TaxID=3886 RepID=A0AAN9MJT1_PHACN
MCYWSQSLLSFYYNFLSHLHFRWFSFVFCCCRNSIYGVYMVINSYVYQLKHLDKNTQYSSAFFGLLISSTRPHFWPLEAHSYPRRAVQEQALLRYFEEGLSVHVVLHNIASGPLTSNFCSSWLL